MDKVFIIGSSRMDGDTTALVKSLVKLTGWDVIDLNDYQISYYDYEHLNRNDDYLSLMQRIVDRYNTLILITPVYWYAMSGIMKVFFDRITDLITIEKDLGRRLRDKNMAVISTSIGNNLGKQFWLPFVETARYLGINYLGNLHTYSDKDYEQQVNHFISTIKEKAKIE